MSKLDNELAEAVAASEEAAPTSERPVAAPSVQEQTPAKKKKLHNVGLVAALLVMGGGVLTLVMTNFEQAAVYSKGVDELIAEKERVAGRNARVTGVLVKGSLKRRDQPCEYRFSMTKNDKVLDVRYPQCVVPDTFRDRPEVDVEVTAEGKLTDEGYFEATQIMAKCPSKYEMKDGVSQGKAPQHKQTLPAGASR